MIDGDTVELRFGGGTEIARLIGIDTPETVHPTKPVECFGPEASAFLSTVLPKNTPVHVTRDVEARDYYGRLLVYLHRSSDNMFVNLQIVETGHATPLSIAPNTHYAPQFAKAAQKAHDAKVGIWGTCRR